LVVDDVMVVDVAVVDGVVIDIVVDTIDDHVHFDTYYRLDFDHQPREISF